MKKTARHSTTHGMRGWAFVGFSSCVGVAVLSFGATTVPKVAYALLVLGAALGAAIKLRRAPERPRR